jgi:uncharacterized membrane protein YbhN (UPF0104 family)
MAGEHDPSPMATTPRSRVWIRWLKIVIRLVLLAIVTWGIWKTMVQASREMAAHEFQWGQVHVAWLVAAGLLYLVGIAPCGIFWHRALWAMGQRPTWRESMRAFWIGHLGKYVPGKAMVVILRTGLVYSNRVNRTVAVTSVFIETLTMMAVGASVAAASLMLTSENSTLMWLALGLMLMSGVPTWPPLFRRLVRWLQLHRANPQIDEALRGVDGRLMGFGWTIISLGWVTLGLSLWATMRALDVGDPQILSSLHELPLLTATVGLAMVAGFLSLIPGGFGVRDWVLMTLLEPHYGARVALVSAILLRIVWLLSELLVSAILYLDVIRVRRRASQEVS